MMRRMLNDQTAYTLPWQFHGTVTDGDYICISSGRDCYILPLFTPPEPSTTNYPRVCSRPYPTSPVADAVARDMRVPGRRPRRGAVIPRTTESSRLSVLQDCFRDSDIKSATILGSIFIISYQARNPLFIHRLNAVICGQYVYRVDPFDAYSTIGQQKLHRLIR